MQKFILSTLFAAGAFAKPLEPRQQAKALWQPQINQKWQIVISSPVVTSTTITPSSAEIYDVDLFQITSQDVDNFHGQGKKVVCYFSAGSGEDWRSDYSSFNQADLGSGLEGWAGEKWLNIRSSSVLNIMKKRIQTAAQKGCDAIDPDNMDGYSNGGGGFNLQPADTVAYLKNLATYAASLGLSTGLKNAQEVLGDEVYQYIQFAVNEECVTQSDRTTRCVEYTDLVNLGKPVLHIEYVDNSAVSESRRNELCLANSGIGGKLDTVIKYLALDGWVLYCDGSSATTPTDTNKDEGGARQRGDPISDDE